MKRQLVTVCTLGFLAFCGGEIVVDQPPGHAGDDGGYFFPDGAAAFTPGAACENYDVSRFSLHSGLGAPSQFVCHSATDCIGPAEDQLPPGDAFVARCGGGDLRFCEFNNYQGGGLNSDPSVYCSGKGIWSEKLKCRPGPDGDAYCSAYYNQFVLGGGLTTATCIPDCSNNDAVDPGVCMPSSPWSCWRCGEGGCDLGACDQLDLCVTRGAETRCEHPCLPSP